jgi:hypothetical protein
MHSRIDAIAPLLSILPHPLSLFLPCLPLSPTLNLPTLNLPTLQTLVDKLEAEAKQSPQKASEANDLQSTSDSLTKLKTQVCVHACVRACVCVFMCGGLWV